MVARAIGPARVQCGSCGKRVAARANNAAEPRLHNCPHGWPCPAIRTSGRPCPLCAEAKQLGLWAREGTS